MADLMLDQPPGFWIIGLLDKIPHLAFRVAESGKGAEGFHVSQHHRRPLDRGRLFSVRFAVGRFGAVELNLLVRTIAEGFVTGLAAAAERVLRWCRIILAILVFEIHPLRLLQLISHRAADLRLRDKGHPL